MKKIFLVPFVLAVMVPMLGRADHNKIDLMLQGVEVESSPAKAMLGKSIATGADGQLVEVLIKSTDAAATAAAIEELGGRVRTIAGTILVAAVPTTELTTLSDCDDVLFIEASKRLSPKMDTARVHANVDDAQAGTVTGSALTGSEVIIGVIDDGFDYGNDAFNGADGKTRVQFVRQCSNSACTAFKLCVKSQIDDGTCTITDGGQGAYHGTHVTGIAGSANATYKGVAPDADIMFLFNSAEDPPATSGDESDLTTFSGAVIDGVTQIFSGADLVDKPAVVNLSLGTSLGAHDDTSLLEQGLNELAVGAGRVIVNAAGNENVNALVSGAGAGGIHATVALSAGQSKAWRFVVLSSSISSFNTAIADIWLSSGDQCQAEGRAYRANAATATTSARVTVGPQSVAEDHTAADNQSDDDTVVLALATDASDVNNSRPHAQLTLTTDSGAQWSSVLSDGDATAETGEGTGGGYVIDVILRATTTTCTGSIWLYPDQTTIVDFLKNIDGNTVSGTSSYQLVDGDSNKTMTIPGTASGVITAGSYLQEKPVGSGLARWTDIDGTTHDQTDVDDEGTGGTVNAVSLFSSLGPTGEVTGSRTKPDVIAPGEPVISTLASGASVSAAAQVDADHLKLEGTSMASPFVTGVVALLLQYNNTLTAAQVKELLTSSAVRLTGQTAANNSAGAGKVDVAGALALTSANSSGFSGTRDVTTDDVNDTGFGEGGATSSESSSSCGGSSLTGAPPSLHRAFGMMLLAFSVGILAFWRRSVGGRKG